MCAVATMITGDLQPSSEVRGGWRSKMGDAPGGVSRVVDETDAEY